MPKEPRPWRRKGIAGAPWYTTLAGKKVYLAPGGATKGEARAELERLRVEGRLGVPARPGAVTVDEAVNLYVGDRKEAEAAGDLTGESLKGVLRFLEPFAARFGALPAAALRAAEAEGWVAAHPGWNATTRARATAMLRACFRWAKRAGHLAANPLEDMKGPKPLKRTAVMTRAQFGALMGVTADREFRDLMHALLWTGCRPKEAATLTADRVDLKAGTWRVLDKMRRCTGETYRTVYLSDEAAELSRRLVALHPEGPVFRNTRGRPWTRAAIGHRLLRVRGPLGIGAEGVAYSLRHLFATDLLERGVAPATVAALMGHSSTAMVMTVYSHLAERTDHLRAAVNGRAAPPAPPSAA